MRISSYFLLGRVDSHTPDRASIFCIIHNSTKINIGYMTKKHKMSTVHQDKANTNLEQPPSSPSNITMTTSLEPQTTDSESCFKPVESSSSDAREDLSVSSKIVDDDENTDSAAPMKGSSKRFLPAYKKANAALTFPEKVRCFNAVGVTINISLKSIITYPVLCFFNKDDEFDAIRRGKKPGRKGVLRLLAS